MNSKLVSCLIFGLIAIFHVESVCDAGWNQIGRFCVYFNDAQSIASSYIQANAMCSFMGATLLNVNRLSDCELLQLQSWLQTNWPADYYFWVSHSDKTWFFAE
jgi:hypothetical protein